MSNRTQKQHDQEAARPPTAALTPEKPENSVDSRNVNSENNNADGRPKKQGIPRWRQIEIMRERAQLRKELSDMDAGFDEYDELEEEVFGSESENEELYVHSEPGDGDEVEFEDDSLDDDDLDDDLGDGLEKGLDGDEFEDFEDQ